MWRYGPIVVLCPAGLVGYWGWCISANAKESAARAHFHLTYRAPEGCPTEAEFAQRVSNGLRAPWQAEASEFAGVVSVTVRQEAQGYAAHSVIAPAHGGKATELRQRVDNCSDVVAAMAFSAADAIRLIWYPAEPSPPPPPLSPELQPHFEAGLNGGRGWQLGPSGAWGGALFVGYRWPVAGWSTTAGLQYWDSGWGTLADAQVRAILIDLHGDLCYQVGLSQSISLPLCSRVELGIHALSGESPVDHSKTSSIGPWVAAGLVPRLRLNLQQSFMELSGGVLFPLYRSDIHTRIASDDPNPKLTYRTPAWAAVLTLGIGWEFY